MRLAVGLIAIWFVLAAGDPGSLIVGVPALATAILLSHATSRGSRDRIRLTRLPRLAGFFVVESLRAGVDVARLAFGRPLRFSSGWERFETALPDGPQRILFLAILSLLPGTLAVDLSGDCVFIHVLDDRQDAVADLRKLETEIARVFRSESQP